MSNIVKEDIDEITPDLQVSGVDYGHHDPKQKPKVFNYPSSWAVCPSSRSGNTSKPDGTVMWFTLR